MEHEVKVITLGISALGITPMKLRNWLKQIGIETQIRVAKSCPPTHC